MDLLFFLFRELQSAATLLPILGLFIIRSYILPTDAVNSCVDTDKDCPMWVSKAARGCDDWLKLNCILSCSICRPTLDKPLPRTISALLNNNNSATTCTDRHSHCSYWANTGQCITNPKFMLVECCNQCRFITKHHLQARHNLHLYRTNL